MKKLLLLTAIAAVATLLFAACDKNGGTAEGPTLSFIKADKSSLSLRADMSEYSFGYSVTGEGQGATVKAAATVDWIEILKVDASTVTFMVKANDKSSREGYINLSLSGAKTVSVFITQNTTKRFDISLSDLTTTGVAVAVKPEAKLAGKTYYYGIVDKRSYLATGKEGVIAQFIAGIKTSINEDDTLSINDFITKGNDSCNFERLWSQTEYYVILFDLDADYNYSGDISLYEFSTEATGVPGTDFAFNIDGTKITVTPKPTAKGGYYIVGLMNIYEWSANPSSFYAAYNYLEQLGSNMKSNLLIGTKTIDFADQLNGSEYDTFVVFAFGTNGNGIPDYMNPDIQTDVAFVKFYYEHPDTAKPSDPSDSTVLQSKHLAGRSAK